MHFLYSIVTFMDREREFFIQRKERSLYQIVQFNWTWKLIVNWTVIPSNCIFLNRRYSIWHRPLTTELLILPMTGLPVLWGSELGPRYPLLSGIRRLNGAVLRKKPEVPCYRKCDTIKIPSCSKAICRAKTNVQPSTDNDDVSLRLPIF